jgi:uncharacterized protein (TIGR02453 family)
MAKLNFTLRAFELLEELAANNEKAWYDEHRKEFETYVREPFGGVLELATERLEETEIPLAGSPKTMFRQNRDVRFSKDKSPYSTHVSGLLTPSGTKAEKDGVVYVHLDSAGGMVACGFYQLKAAELGPIRDRIVEKPAVFSHVLKDLNSAGLSLSDEDKLTAMPRGYGEYEKHEYAECLKLKSFIVKVELGRGAWLDGDIVDCIVEYAKNCASLLEFGRTAREAEVLG